jgi:hypothetical protein
LWAHVSLDDFTIITIYKGLRNVFGFVIIIWFIVYLLSCMQLKHDKPPIPKVWPIKLVTNITQCEVDALGRTTFVLVLGASHVTPIT